MHDEVECNQTKSSQSKIKNVNKGSLGHFAVVDVVDVAVVTHHLVVVNFANGPDHAVHHNNGRPV